MTDRLDDNDLSEMHGNAVMAAESGFATIQLSAPIAVAVLAELRELRQAQAGGWVSISDALPDSDVWVLVCGPEADYVVVQLEFTDDSEGRGEPYWAAGEGELALCNYPHWLALPNPPEGP